MRILVDLKSHLTGAAPLITQVEKVPPIDMDGVTVINGKYLIPVAPGADFRVDDTDYVLDGSGEIDGGDVSSISYAHLLAAYPMFEFVYFNPLLTADHVGELDLTATFSDPPDTFPTRAQTGRALGGDAGQMPTSTAVLKQNPTISPARPGMLISDLIDISAFTGGGGADEFMLFWKLYAFFTTDDVMADSGLLAGTNTPAHRLVAEVPQEPNDFLAYISVDDGTTWNEVGLLEPIFTAASTDFRVAFRNNGTDERVYIATFGVLF